MWWRVASSLLVGLYLGRIVGESYRERGLRRRHAKAAVDSTSYGFEGLLPEAERLAAVRLAAPDIARALPLRFDPSFTNPCWRDANRSGALSCLPAFFIAGGMQCGVGDLWSRLRQHGQIRSEHDPAAHWWTNHPRSRAGDFNRYVGPKVMTRERAVAGLELDPSSLLGDVSPATFAFMFAEQLRMHYLWLDAFSACHAKCRSRRPPDEHAERCRSRSYDLAHCYGEADAATVPLTFNVPSLIRTVYGERAAPRVVVLLRDPSLRLWTAFFNYGQYPSKYGQGVLGFSRYFGNQSAAFSTCTRKFGTRRCALRFEGYSSVEAGVYYHCDQLIKGMYAIYLPEWQAAIPADKLLVLRSEAYLAQPARSLKRVGRLLGLRRFNAKELAAAQRVRSTDELEHTVRAHGEPPPSALEPVRRFYAPFNRALATQLGDEAFLWEESSTSR